MQIINYKLSIIATRWTVGRFFKKALHKIQKYFFSILRNNAYFIHFMHKMYISIYFYVIFVVQINTTLYMVSDKVSKKSPVVKERMTVPVQVHPTVREFIIDTYGSDVIIPDSQSQFWTTVKYYLKLPPVDYRTPETKDNIIHIALLDSLGAKSVNKQAGKLLHVDTLFRWYLSEDGQKEIAKHLRRELKHTFHCFVQGAVACNPKLEQRQAMEEFCKLYNLTLNELSEDMLKKSWDRSPHKTMVIKRKFKFCPLFF